MVLPRPSSLRGAQIFGRVASRRAGIQARENPLKNIGRRSYASGHEAKKSSDLPWMIGAVVFTVPAATWLLGQGPSKSDHGHGHGEHEEKHEEGGEEESKEEESTDTKDEDTKEEAEAESKDEGKDEKQEKDDSATDAKAQAKDDSKDDAKNEKEDSQDGAEDKDSGDSKAPLDEDYDGPSSGTKAQYFRNPNKKPGEGQKGDRPPTEKKGEKDSKTNYSGAEHPYISDPSKSRKSAGVTETAKIHGTAKPTYANPTEPSRPAPPSENNERA